MANRNEKRKGRSPAAQFESKEKRTFSEAIIPIISEVDMNEKVPQGISLMRTPPRQSSDIRQGQRVEINSGSNEFEMSVSSKLNDILVKLSSVQNDIKEVKVCESNAIYWLRKLKR